MDGPDGLRLVYEDTDFLIVEKPSGMHSAPLKPDEKDTALTRLLAQYPEIGSVPGIKAVEPGLLHRLDRETSGVLLVARTETAFHFLRREMENGKILKKYVALCNRSEPSICPDGWDMENWRDRLNRLQTEGLGFTVSSRFRAFGPRGGRVAAVTDGMKVSRKKRVTRMSYQTRIFAEQATRGRVRCRIRLIRGFRHQIRVHLAASGLPIAGDPLYGCPEKTEGRMYLHAYSLELKHPVTRKPITVQTEIPDIFG